MIRSIRLLAAAAALASTTAAPAAQSAHEVPVVASKYRFEPSTIQVSPGETVRLVLRSKDGVHGFAIPKLTKQHADERTIRCER